MSPKVRIIVADHWEGISGDVVTIEDVSSEHTALGRLAVHTINGSGFNSSTGVHGIEPDGEMWLTDDSTSVPATITFDLGVNTDLDSVTVWNYNEPGDYTNRGANSVEILIADSDSSPVFTSLGNFTFTQAPGTAGNFGQIIDLTGYAVADDARLVRIIINSNHSGGADSYVGLSEVVFNWEGAVRRASNPSPPNGSGYANSGLVLSWTPGLSSDSHNVFIGTDFNDVNDAVAGTALICDFDYSSLVDFNDLMVLAEQWLTDPCDLVPSANMGGNGIVNMADYATVASQWNLGGVYRGNTVEASFVPNAILEPDTTYYWRIDEVDEPNIIKGDIWNFTVDNRTQWDIVEDWSETVNTDTSRWSYRSTSKAREVGTVMPYFHIVYDSPSMWTPGPSPYGWDNTSGDNVRIFTNKTDTTQSILYEGETTMIFEPNTCTMRCYLDHPTEPVPQVSWLCPKTGLYDITYEFAHDRWDANSIGGRELDGQHWYLDKVSGGALTNLANGYLQPYVTPYGGGSGLVTLSNVSLTAGDRINWNVDPLVTNFRDHTEVTGTINWIGVGDGSADDLVEIASRYNTDWQPGAPVRYIRPYISDFEVPAYDGQTYQDTVPDTFDLQERAELSINVLTRATDPNADFEQYFFVNFRSDPPVMQHTFIDQCQMKFMEALPLLRTVTGSTLNSEVDQRWMEMALHRLGSDGLAYTPTGGRPWAFRNLFSSYLDEGDQFIEPVFGGRLLSSMMLYYRRDANPVWKEGAERLVDALADLAIDKGSYAYYSPSAWLANKSDTYDYGVDRFDGAHVAFLIPGLVHVYKDTGYQPAATLADKLIRYTLDELDYFNADGSFAPETPGGSYAHFHMHSVALLAMVEYGHAVGDTDILALSQLAYEYGKSVADTNLGYFPSTISGGNDDSSEFSSVADMIAIGLKLTEAGYGDYYDDIDRWVRNGLAERQLTQQRADLIEAQAWRFPDVTPDPTFETGDSVIDRNIGAFPGWNLGALPGKAGVNEWGNAITQDCTGNGARAIYYVWDHALRKTGADLRVNLLFNRASQWADIHSYIPYEGRVDVKIKQACDLSVRIPEWVTPAQVSCEINDTSHTLGWDGRYAVVGAVSIDDVVKMTFPISERVEVATIGGQQYTLTIKGSDVVNIDPPGQYCPLYQREHYRTGPTLFKDVTRFVTDESIQW